MANQKKHIQENHSAAGLPSSFPDDECQRNIPSSEFLKEILLQSKAYGSKGDTAGITKQEATRIESAFQDEEFRKLLSEYVEEISDPRHRAEQNEYIRYLEEQNAVPRGKKLIRPIPCFVLKFKFAETKKSAGNEEELSFDQKLFVNIVTSVDIKVPESSVNKNQDEQGTRWSIPYTVGPIRTEYDKSKLNLVPTCDCCFHPNALSLAKSNSQFKELLVGIARQAALKQIKSDHGGKISIDSTFHRVLQGAKYMNNEPTVLVVSTFSTSVSNDTKTHNSLSTELTEIKVPICHGKQNTLATTKDPVRVKSLCKESPQDSKPSTLISPPLTLPGINCEHSVRSYQEEFITPKHSISERGIFDIACSAADVKTVTFPPFLVVRISLPKICCISELELEVSEERLVLTSLPFEQIDKKGESVSRRGKPSDDRRSKYALTCKLPYPTWADQGQAEWNKLRHVLTVTLPVKQVLPLAIDVRNDKEDLTSVNVKSDASASEAENSASVDAELQLSTSKPLNTPKLNENAHSRWIEKNVNDQILPLHEHIIAVELVAPINNVCNKTKYIPEKTIQCDDKLEVLSLSMNQQQDIIKCNEKIVVDDTEACIDRSMTYISDFDASNTYNGSRLGFVFRRGVQGLGYYKDDYLNKKQVVEASGDGVSRKPMQAVSMKFNAIQCDLAIRID